MFCMYLILFFTPTSAFEKGVLLSWGSRI